MAISKLNPLRILWKKLPAPLRNKYILSGLLFFVLLIFLDRHDLITQMKLHQAIKRLERDKAYYEQKTQQAEQDRKNMDANKEQFAREKYNMHRADEDVFIIQNEN